MDWHIITGEFPPASGGVSDYSGAIATALASAGEDVHVWCPAVNGSTAKTPGVTVHGLAGAWARVDLARVDAALNQTPAPRRLFVQWVPHAFGKRSLNIAFCRWLRRRARSGDRLELMVHEPYLAFGEGSIRQDAAAAVHRLMVVLLLRQAQRVWVAIPAWADSLRSWTLGRDLPFCWLPIPSTVPVAASRELVAQVRGRFLRRPDGLIVGHFGTYSREVTQDLHVLVPRILATGPEIQLSLIGRGSEEALEGLRGLPDVDGSRLQASGEVEGPALSYHLQACDLMVQPYRDGASTRRTTLMAALAHGLPVVTTVGRLSEPFWTESNAAALVPAGDLAAVARLVSELAHQPERRQKFGEHARATYDARFSLPHVVEILRAGTCQAL